MQSVQRKRHSTPAQHARYIFRTCHPTALSARIVRAIKPRIEEAQEHARDDGEFINEPQERRFTAHPVTATIRVESRQ